MRERFDSIQYLRAVAALGVVFAHASLPRDWLYSPVAHVVAGDAGVDIFFVISGFVMYTAAREEPPLEFLRRRIVRIVPLYYLATFLLVFRDMLSTRQWPTWEMTDHLLKSLAFIPHYGPGSQVHPWPYLVPGWTLNYEMFFYLVFAVGLWTGRVTLTVLCTLLPLVVIGFLMPSDNALWITYTNSLLLEFMAGMMLARYRALLPGVVGWPLILLGLVGIGFSALSAGLVPRAVQLGIPALAVVTGAVALERAGKVRDLRLPRILGDASYSIYLFQALGIAIAAAVVRRLPLSGPVQFLAMVTASLVAAALVGILVHYLVERPITRVLRDRFAGRRADVGARAPELTASSTQG